MVAKKTKITSVRTGFNPGLPRDDPAHRIFQGAFVRGRVHFRRVRLRGKRREVQVSVRLHFPAITK